MTRTLKSKQPRKLVSFDWAIKRLLRSKANFVVLEGFLSELLKRDVKIEKVLESETNRDASIDKTSRVDLLVSDSERGLVIVEVQYESEVDYFQRMLYSSSRVVSEHLRSGHPYGESPPVISVNIVYFDLGHGEDYVYQGRTEFVGIHKGDRLGLSENQKELFERQSPAEFFPIYYILKVNSFNDKAKDGLDEWIYFLKNEAVKPGSKAKGLKEAEEALDLIKLSEKDRRAYEEYQADLHRRASLIEYSIKRADKEFHRAEEALRQREEERRQKESLLETAIKALVKTGMSEKQAIKQLKDQ